jgi:hypothetical protein
MPEHQQNPSHTFSRRPQSRRLARAFARLLAPALLLASALLLGGSGCTSDSATSSCRTVLNCKEDVAPICDAASLSCRSCQPGQDDLACKNRNASTPRCGPAGRCVGCMGNSECSDLRYPVCSAQNSCVGCQQATDCASRVCSADGSCAPTSDVLFVDNSNGSCTGSAHSGASGDPFCNISDAVGAANSLGRSLITVAPSSSAYDWVNISSVPAAGLRLSSSSGVAASVQVNSVSNSAFTVSATGGKVVVSGFAFSSAKGNGIDCAGGTDLTVLGSRISQSQNGIVANGCKLTLDGVRVYSNRTNGIVILGNSSYVINNIMVWSNSNSGVSITSSSGTLRFATVYANGGAGITKAPGVDCGAGQNLIESSIVYNNLSATGPNFTDNQVLGCATNNVIANDGKSSVYGGTYIPIIDFITGTGPDPTVYDLRLKPDSVNNQGAAIDKVPQAAGLIDHDVDGVKRPQGAGWDIGAAEAR